MEWNFKCKLRVIFLVIKGKKGRKMKRMKKWKS